MKKLLIGSVCSLFLLSTNLLAISGKHTTIGINGNGSNGEICIFCHTPHFSNQAAGSPQPLWNKPMIDTVFKMYGATVEGVAGVTLAGTPTDIQPEGQTLACLTCHDGISAMNSVINAPGAGLVGAATDGPGENVYISTSSPKPMGKTDQMMAIGAPIQVGWNGSPIYSSYGALHNDHPLSITYIEGRGSLKNVNTSLTNFWRAEKISDLLRDGKVHCVSCHDPHGGTGHEPYLRSSNTGSALCFGCHDK